MRNGNHDLSRISDRLGQASKRLEKGRGTILPKAGPKPSAVAPEEGLRSRQAILSAALKAFARDGYELVLAGHTHGGQVRVPFGPAIVTNCGIDVRRARWLHKWDDQTWFHVSAGLGTGPYSPLRIACRPEVTLLTLVSR